jgi:hypothetical protein
VLGASRALADLKFGKGVYIWQPASMDGGNPESIAARLQMAGVQTAVVKISDGFKVLTGYEPLIQTLRNHGIRVGAWGYSYLNRAPIQEAHVVAEACHRYTPDFFLIDVEAEVEGNYGGAGMFMSELRPATAGLPLGLNTFWNVQLHPDFPWRAFMNAVDFVCPQVYWRGVDPVGKLITCQQSYTAVPYSPDVPMPAVAGDLYVHLGVKPTPGQVTEFLQAADDDPFIGGVLMWAADDTQTTPELWQAFSQYQWKSPAASVQDQPLGWAKVKAPRGIWVRSSANGAKVGALGKAELAPIWSLTDTKWGAITKTRDQWIFLGEPQCVDTTLSGPADQPSPGMPSLYRARVVPARGLNVRDGVRGQVLRALECNAVVEIYEERTGWVRIHGVDSEWVDAAYLAKLSEPVPA